ncbi:MULTISPECIES: restriction endonuclease subunit S [Methylomonas]|uniref:Type I restriction modification DNA specificity domain-containing protein n=1 Tax=Methylomonas koyamae TaxID=702114 RepID=A0A177P825_9GAMM|nr:restriction endonuclease subunit S [Methylomonas koyamae]OAI26468.1 hypothetical protein A1355_18860 [Methylomonas koyamae]
MSFPRYPEYKDSGVEWLGEVPEHWEVKRLKSVLSQSLMYGANEAADDDNPEHPRFVRITDITDNGSLRNETFRSLSPDIATSYLLIEGDVLLARSGATVGKSFIYRQDWGVCCFAGYLIRARIDVSKMLASFLYACCQTSFYWQFINSSQIQATIQNVSAERYANSILPRPPLKEQQTIAAFLDRETAKIDALIAEQQRLIELLKEKRQAVISHAVTKGLNPNAPMKDSGIEWLGEVQEHWASHYKLNDLARQERNSFVNGPFGSDLLTSELIQEGVPVIYIRDLKAAGYTRISEWCVTKEKARQLNFCNVYPGDILIAKVGDPPGLAVLYPAGEPDGIITQDVIRIRVNEAMVDQDFLIFLLNSNYGRALIDNISIESTRTRVSLGEYKQLRMVVPPKEEQILIATFLNSETTKLDTLTAEAQRAITLLKERRTALISAAVTGKIDVRGFS